MLYIVSPRTGSQRSAEPPATHGLPPFAGFVASFRVGSATDYLASVGFVAGDEVATYDERSSRSSLHQLGMIGLGELEQAVGQRPGGRLKFRVRKNRDPPCAWHRLFQQFEPLRHEFDGEYPRNPAGHEVVDELGCRRVGCGARNQRSRGTASTDSTQVAEALISNGSVTPSTGVPAAAGARRRALLAE